MLTCSIDGCDKPVINKRTGWCLSHYNKWSRHGDPLYMTKKYATGEQISEFIKSAKQSETDDCIIWPYGKCNGYAWTGSQYVHRIIASGEQTVLKSEPAHLCDNRLCVNPRHVVWSTRSDNILDHFIGGDVKQRMERRS